MNSDQAREDLVRDYVEAGFALVPVPFGTKGPRVPGWNLQAMCVSDVSQIECLSENVGLAHAYSGTCVVDIDDLDATVRWFAARSVTLESYLQSAESVKIVSGRPNRAKLLYRTDRPRVTKQISVDGRGIFELRCAASNGKTVQDLIPPSVHPDTQQPYQWEGDWRSRPNLPSEIAKIWDELEGLKQNASKVSAELNGNSAGASNMVLEGGRNSTLTKIAGAMRRRGLDVEAINAALQEHNLSHCRPPLPVDEVRKIAESVSRYEPDPVASAPKYSRQELEAMIEATNDVDELIKEIPRRIYASELCEAEVDRLIKMCAKKGKVDRKTLRRDAIEGNGHHEDETNHLHCARKVIGAIGEENIICVADTFWRWNSTGVWARIDDREVKRVIQDECPAVAKTAGTVASICDFIKTQTLRPNHKFDINTSEINCQNGRLSFANGCWEVQPHMREDYCTSQIPHEYGPDAKAPRFERFLREAFACDSDSDHKIAVVEELMGYTLLRDCRFEKFVLLVGRGANGKSVLLKVVAELVGSENVCAVQPDKLNDTFQRAHMHGKLMNLVTEIAVGVPIADAQMKALVSGELTTAEHKNRDPFEFRPCATMWLGSNHLPSTRDPSPAMRRRAIIIQFNRVFEEGERDPQLFEKLQQEMPGILNVALRGLARLYTQKGFTKCESVDAALREWQLETDQVMQFIEDECERGPDFSDFSANLYGQYSLWHSTSGLRGSKLTRRNFSSRLDVAGFSLYRTSSERRVAGLRVRPSIAEPGVPHFKLVKVAAANDSASVVA
jgi:putative DNA primase/helicase